MAKRKQRREQKTKLQGIPKRAPGRPSKYKPEFVAQAQKLCELGATDREIAKFFGVSDDSLLRWRYLYPEFCGAMRTGKDACDDRVMHSLYHKAVGYSFDSVKIMQHEGSPLIVPYVEHVPPSDTAIAFWLKNRRPNEWRDKIEHTGPEGGAIKVEIVRFSEIAKPVDPPALPNAPLELPGERGEEGGSGSA